MPTDRRTLVRVATLALAAVVAVELVYAASLIAPATQSGLERTGRRLLQLVYADQPPDFGPLGQPDNWGGTLYYPLAQDPPDPAAAAADGAAQVLTDPHEAALAAAVISGPVSRRLLAAHAPALPRRIGLQSSAAAVARRLLQEPQLIGSGGQHFGIIPGDGTPATTAPTLPPLGVPPSPPPGTPVVPVTPPPVPVTPAPTPVPVTPAPVTPAPVDVSTAAATRPAAPAATTQPAAKGVTVIVPMDAFQPQN